MNIIFNQLWPLLYNHGASECKRAEAAALFETYTPEQQQQILTTISSKLKENKFVQYNPIRAIKENVPRRTERREPTNYNGRPLPTDGTRLVRARYNGKGGVYSLEDAKAFKMTEVQPF